jgi:hypothetical protein
VIEVDGMKALSLNLNIREKRSNDFANFEFKLSSI